MSRRYWDRAARANAAWYVATGYASESNAFFEQGAIETDLLLRFCGVPLDAADTVLEIGCGVGRMTRRLSELAGQVIATDVSDEMLRRCRDNLAGRANVACMLLPGDGSIPAVDTGSVQVVFSYITLQHVPSRQAQSLYLQESARVLAPGGRIAIQVRGVSFTARLLDWLGHVRHVAAGRATLNRAWRGARLSDADISRALAGGSMNVSTIAYDRRHRWVVGHKAPAGEA
jgi:SAM-dependent methyltransferase